MADEMNVPNYTAMFANAYESGRTIAKSKGVQNALSIAQTDPLRAQGELMRYGATDEANALAKRQADQKAVALRTQVAPMVASGNYSGAQSAAAEGADFELAGQIAKMDETQRARATENAQVLAGIGLRLKDVPYDQAKAAIQHAKPALVARGIPAEMIDGFDPTPENIDALVGSSMSLKDQIAATDRSADNNRADQQFQETVRYHDEMIGLGNGRLGLSRQKEGRISKGGGGSGGGVSGLPAGFQLVK